MFDDVLRKLKNMEHGIQVSIEMPLDDEGYFDRVCPHKECQREFKVLFKDWKEKVSDERVFCPFCGYIAKSDEWDTDDQTRYIGDVGLKYIKGQLDQSFSEGAKNFNRRQPRNGFITMNMEYKPGQPVIVIPCKIADMFQQKFSCEICGCNYASIGASFFCPACGHNSVEHDFDRSVEVVLQLLNSLVIVKATVQEHQDKDVAEDTIRQILETSLGKLTGAFQRLMETIFNKVPSAKRVKQNKNIFQNLIASSKLWQQVGLKAYSDLLEVNEWADMQRLFQQRHLIAHCEGIVDQDYIDKSGDLQYKVGQRLVIREEAVRRFAEVILKLADKKREEIKGQGEESKDGE